jgi:hypothetical protein
MNSGVRATQRITISCDQTGLQRAVSVSQQTGNPSRRLNTRRCPVPDIGLRGDKYSLSKAPDGRPPAQTGKYHADREYVVADAVAAEPVSILFFPVFAETAWIDARRSWKPPDFAEFIGR